jgi:uncharacterized protein (DUF1778 family)
MNRDERIAVRVPADVKAILQHAADLTGRSLSDFVVASAQAAAEETIRERQIIQLTVRDSLLLAEALLNPPPPNEKLKAAFEEYNRFLETGRIRERGSVPGPAIGEP